MVNASFYLTVFLYFQSNNKGDTQSSILITLIIACIACLGTLYSWFFSKKLAIKSHDLNLIQPEGVDNTDDERFLCTTVSELSRKAGLEVCPDVAIYDSPDMNAFATGRSHNNALVAFSSGLMESMPRNEVRAVVAHEIAHIVNRDMLGTVLIQGFFDAVVLVVTAPFRLFRVFLSSSRRDSVSVIIDYSLRFLAYVSKVLLNFIGMICALFFSRHREYGADHLAAKLSSKEDMTAALQRLNGDPNTAPESQADFATFKISGKFNLHEFFSTHPPIEKRIIALKDSGSVDS